MLNFNSVPEVFKSQDTIYHYCPTITAIEHILFEKRLRLSPRNLSFDPIENLERSVSEGGVYQSEEERLAIQERTYEDVNRMKTDLKKRYSKAKQVCFCKNAKPEEFIGMSTPPHEYYGFFKPRMWDQYGDKYGGICLSFSKDKLKEIHDGLSHDVDYVPYDHLFYNHLSIRHNEIDSNGFDEYYRQFIERTDKSLSRKHKDYSEENEFRMYSFSESEYEYIDISTAINGIIVSTQNLSKFSEEQLIRFSKELGIELLYLNWKSSGVSVTTLEDSEKVYTMI